MTETAPLLNIENLSVSYQTLRGRVSILDGVSLSVGPGEIVGLVGESGSGKSMTAFSILRLLGAQGRIDEGRIDYDGVDLVGKSEPEMTEIRGRDISMIFQEPMTSLNPVNSIGLQISEVLTQHLGMTRRQARERAIELLAQVGIPSPEDRISDYPHQLSGGMRQRVMIAMALGCGPKLLIADEPTTALDVTIQAQILDLLRQLQSDTGMSILLITHDLGVVAEITRRVVVMYAGQVVEEATVEEIFETPLHPYTSLLLKSIPTVRERREVLPVIPGSTPAASEFLSGCRFHDRCPEAFDKCRTDAPVLESTGPNRSARCWLLANAEALS